VITGRYRKKGFRWPAFAAAAAVGIALAVAGSAFADNVQNSVASGEGQAIGGTVTLTLPYASVDVPYWIQAPPNDCDPSTTPANVTINVPAGVTASPDSLTFTACGDKDTNSQSVTFTVTGGTGTYDIPAVTAPGDYSAAATAFKIVLEAAGGGGGGGNANPTITSVSTSPSTIFEGSSTTVTVSATDSDGGTLAYEFDCANDGTYEIGPQAPNQAVCSYADNVGSPFTVGVRVTDGQGGSAAGSTTVTVNNALPVINSVSLTGNGVTACVGGNEIGLSFNFSDAGVLDYPWAPSIAWGDSSSSNSLATLSSQGPAGPFNHTYSAGTYTPVVTVTDKDGGSGSSSSLSSQPQVSLFYSTGQGILQPINYTGPRSAFKLGSTIPVKTKITDCNGAAVSGLTLTVSLRKLDGTPDGTSVEDVYSTVPDQGTTMRFTGTPDYQYIYNLGTKNLTQGDYEVKITGATIAPISATFSIKK
jgi:hypothetical protein